jgi:hypothetical protein
LQEEEEEEEEYAGGGAGCLLERFEHFLPLVEQGITQASLRVLEGEHLPAPEKLLSLFEEHTQIITRHKAGKPREFGRKVLIEEVEGASSVATRFSHRAARSVPSFPRV